MKRKNPHPPAPSPNIARSGAGKKSLSLLGEGFRVRAKTTVLNIDKVQIQVYSNGLKLLFSLFYKTLTINHRFIKLLKWYQLPISYFYLSK